MRLTIIPDDFFVAVDGDTQRQPLDLSNCGIPEEVHALQWFDTRGWIEFDDPKDPFLPKPPNQEISSLPIWADNCVVAWEEWTPPPIPTNTLPVTTVG